MPHFDRQSLHQIKDTEPHSWATVRADDGFPRRERGRWKTIERRIHTSRAGVAHLGPPVALAPASASSAFAAA